MQKKNLGACSSFVPTHLVNFNKSLQNYPLVHLEGKGIDLTMSKVFFILISDLLYDFVLENWLKLVNCNLMLLLETSSELNSQFN